MTDNEPPDDDDDTPPPPVDLFGTPWYMLHKRGDPDTSREAAKLVETTKEEKRNFFTLLNAGPRGITTTFAAMILGKMNHAVSPRWAALVRKGLVRDSGERRKSPKTTRREIVWKVERRKKPRAEPPAEPADDFELE